jgi:hypothetical protein
VETQQEDTEKEGDKEGYGGVDRCFYSRETIQRAKAGAKT